MAQFVVTRFLVAGLLVLVCSCAQEAPPLTTTEVMWQPLGSWSGRGNSQTGSFTVETGAMRMQWETRNESPSGAGTFRVQLFSSISGRALQMPVDHHGPGRDTTYFQDDPRVSYLVIESANLEWTLSVDEAISRTIRPAAK